MMRRGCLSVTVGLLLVTVRATQVPVKTRISTDTTTLPTGSQLNLPCEVDGFPEPEVYWTKDSERLTPSDRISITGTSISRLTISDVSVGDGGLYGCHANNAYSDHYSTLQITVNDVVKIPPKCTDNPFFANCHLIVASKFCNHKYYSKFCCKSCVEAGQLTAHDLQMMADQPSPYNKK